MELHLGDIEIVGADVGDEFGIKRCAAAGRHQKTTCTPETALRRGQGGGHGHRLEPLHLGGVILTLSTVRG